MGPHDFLRREQLASRTPQLTKKPIRNHLVVKNSRVNSPKTHLGLMVQVFSVLLLIIIPSAARQHLPSLIYPLLLANVGMGKSVSCQSKDRTIKYNSSKHHTNNHHYPSLTTITTSCNIHHEPTLSHHQQPWTNQWQNCSPATSHGPIQVDGSTRPQLVIPSWRVYHDIFQQVAEGIWRVRMVGEFH